MKIDCEAFYVVAFDIFGTLLDMSGVDRGEMKAYGQHIRQPKWSPLTLPSSWLDQPFFPDVADGVKELRRIGLLVVTCSNAPVSFQRELFSRHPEIEIHDIISLEEHEVFKPRREAYLAICEQLEVDAEHVLMVTANEHFGDLEGAKSVGMQSILIRGKECPTVLDLAKMIGGDE